MSSCGIWIGRLLAFHLFHHQSQKLHFFLKKKKKIESLHLWEKKSEETTDIINLLYPIESSFGSTTSILFFFFNNNNNNKRMGIGIELRYVISRPFVLQSSSSSISSNQKYIKDGCACAGGGSLQILQPSFYFSYWISHLPSFALSGDEASSCAQTKRCGRDYTMPLWYNFFRFFFC